MIKKLIVFLFAFSLFFPVISAQSSTKDGIVDHIIASGKNTITQPDAIYKYLEKKITESDMSEDDITKLSPGTGKIGGYRVQVFSDNNSKTAKNEARAKSRTVGDYFPKYRTYVFYNSPYWRVRVGDFKTYKEAEEAMEEISNAFPAMSKEIRIVKDRININN